MDKAEIKLIGICGNLLIYHDFSIFTRRLSCFLLKKNEEIFSGMKTKKAV